MNVRRAIVWLAPLALAGALTAAWGVRAPKVNASLYDLIGRAAERIPKFVRESSEGEISVIVSSEDGAMARAAAKAMGLSAGNGRGRDDTPGDALAFLRENRGGLVAPETAALLATAEGRAKVARRAMRRLYGSPLPPVLGFADDPFGLADGFLATLMPKPAAKTPEGYPVLVTNGVTHVLVRHRLADEVAGDIDKMIATVWDLRKEGDRVASDAAGAPRPRGRVTVRLAGAPVHSAVAAARSKGEIGVLTWFSLAVIAVLALLVFRSWRWLPLLGSSLAVAALAGALTLALLFRELHVMTLLMGTTVLGLVIDYSFHWLLSSEAAKPAVKRGLAVSFLTTEISLVPLMLASIPVLRQSAVFLAVGLAAALAYVWCGYPSGRSAELPHRCSTFNLQPPTWMLLPVAGLAVAGLFRCEIKTEVAALYRPPAELLEAEKLRSAFGTFNVAAFPSMDERRKNAANVAALYAEYGAEMAKALGTGTLVPPPEPRDLILQPKALMDSIFADWTAESLRRLGFSVIALLAVLAVLCRRRALRLIVPPLAAILVVAGALGWAGVAINLFHLLAAFLLLGMGIDYSVFLQSGERTAFRPALCSLLTSVAGFGALAYVSFPVVRSFGVVLGAGLPVAFVAAMTLSERRGGDAASTEHGASLLGMETLFLLYRAFGLRFLHLLASAVGTCVWCCSPAVRRASPSIGKLVNFTRSLADKLVVMAEGRRLPSVATDGSPDAAAFVEDVRSGRGVFVLSSHVGTIEVLPAFSDCVRTFHAWMDFDRTGVFNRFYLRHAKRRKVVIHPISEFGMGTVFEAGDAIDAGDCLVMAGDRGDGAFRFAAAFDHPVYFVACVAESGCRYRAVIRRLPSDRDELSRAYRRILAELSSRHPEQHFVWEPRV